MKRILIFKRLSIALVILDVLLVLASAYVSVLLMSGALGLWRWNPIIFISAAAVNTAYAIYAAVLLLLNRRRELVIIKRRK